MAENRRAGKKQKADLAQKAYQGIRQMLFYNEILPGQKIKYQDLADRIGVSITPVIHALKWLEFKNIVRHEPNRGCFVNEANLQEITEIYDTRLVLEVSMVPAILRFVDPDAVRRLDQARNAYIDAVNKDDNYNRLMMDMTFHMTLASISKCRIQINMLQELFDLLLLKYTRNLILLGIMDTSLREHETLCRHLEERDAEGLQTSLSTHLENVRAFIIGGYKRMFALRSESRVAPFSNY